MQPNSKTVIVATTNRGKVMEYKHILGQLGYEVRSLGDYPALPEVVEDGETFEANALKKAREISERLGIAVVADDSGLVVDALGGEPGIYSARYAGVHGSDAANNAKVLAELRRRGAEAGGGDAGSGSSAVRAEAGSHTSGETFLSDARFVCVLAMVDPSTGRTVIAEGVVEGKIVPEPRGENGFGYDPLFYVPEYGMTMAEVGFEVKNRISHRSKALHKLMKLIEAET